MLLNKYSNPLFIDLLKKSLFIDKFMINLNALFITK